MKKLIVLLLIAAFIPATLLAQGDGYKLMYSKLNEEQLQSQRQRVNNEILSASLVSAGGVTLTGLGVLSATAGVAMVVSEPFIVPDPDVQGIFYPYAFLAVVFQYVGGIALIGSGIGLGATGVGLVVSANGNIAFQMQKKHQIQLEMKKFKPVSQEYTPGVGVGFSFSLND